MELVAKSNHYNVDYTMQICVSRYYASSCCAPSIGSGTCRRQLSLFSFPIVTPRSIHFRDPLLTAFFSKYERAVDLCHCDTEIYKICGFHHGNLENPVATCIKTNSNMKPPLKTSELRKEKKKRDPIRQILSDFAASRLNLPACFGTLFSLSWWGVRGCSICPSHEPWE